VFVAAAKHLSFTQASQELFVTQAAISHQIKQLEEHLGIKLFLRRNRTLLLTEEGQAYYQDIKEVFGALEDATEKLLARGAKGAITIGSPPSFASTWLVPRLSLFSQAYPDIDVRLKAVDFDDGFLSDDMDVAVYYGRGRWSGLLADKLHDEYITPVCSPLLLEKSPELTDVSKLDNQTLLHDESRSGWRNWLRLYGLTHINVNQGPVFSHSMLVLQAAALGQGVALANTVLAKPELESGRLICPFQEKLAAKDAFYLVADKLHYESEKVTAFREWMLGLVASESGL
jgi:LysR family glycine cleavage system transcriptional activator